MARGTEAKAKVAEVLRQAFGDKYIGEFEKKHYVWAEDNGEMVQIAISMTCPKVFVGLDLATAPAAPATEFDWSTNDLPEPNPAETKISDEEMDKIAKLMEQLGL